tara:strand:- start:8144 stop:8674 length:531 start_codon:yes stop_codon:yes gene_type:complete
MQHNKETAYVQYVDNFFNAETLESLQETFLNLKYTDVQNEDGSYGKRHTFSLPHFKNDPILARIKEFFFPYTDLDPISIHAHLRHTQGKPKVHIDNDKGNIANFLLFIKGEPLLNNGTGFFIDGKLSSHIGFVENRALFFNGSKIWHSDLQTFGDSSPRYTLNIFYKTKVAKDAGF